MTAGRRNGPTKRRSPPHYTVPPLRLTDGQRMELALGLWRARRVLLSVAAQHASLRSLALPAAKDLTQAVETLWPEPRDRDN